MKQFFIILACILLLIPVCTRAQWVRHDICDDIEDPYGVAAGDFDQDQRVDVIVGQMEMDQGILCFYGIEDGWVEYTVEIERGGSDFTVADFDLDGDLDFAGCSYEASDVGWWENTGERNFQRHQLAYRYYGASSMDSGYLNRDGLPDFVCTAWYGDAVVWWENKGLGEFEPRLVTDNYSTPHDVAIGDINGDAIPDFAVCSGIEDCLHWFERTSDGTWIDHLVADGMEYVSGIKLADYDKDGDNDIFATVFIDNLVLLFVNDGFGNFDVTYLCTDFYRPWDLCICDIGSDGDPDVFVTSYNTGIRYWENDDGVFTEHVLIDIWDHSRGIVAIDMDGDYDQDIVAVSEYANEVAWWEQPGQGYPDPIEITITPHDPPVYIPQGGSFYYDVHIVSNLNYPVNAFVWTDVFLPAGCSVGPIDQLYVPLCANADILVTNVSQTIPYGLSLGYYLWRVNIGQTPQNSFNSDLFMFTVTEGQSEMLSPDWKSAGWTGLTNSKNAAQTSPGAIAFQLDEVFPNPFNANTRIEFTLPESRQVTARVYDSLGRQVADLANGKYSAGRHALTFKTDGLATGIYFLQFGAGSEHEIRKLVYLK